MNNTNRIVCVFCSVCVYLKKNKMQLDSYSYGSSLCDGSNSNDITDIKEEDYLCKMTVQNTLGADST